MHGLRCTPALLGWTRLLDEWVVGLTHYSVSEPGAPVCWATFETTVETLARAATRVRSFAGRERGVAPTVASPKGTMSFELQGVDYGVAAIQRWPTAPGELTEHGVAWLEEAVGAAKAAHSSDMTRVGVVFVTPRLEVANRSERAAIVEAFIAANRVPGSDGCGFSFPEADATVEYHYANDEFPGAMLLIAAAD